MENPQTATDRVIESVTLKVIQNHPDFPVVCPFLPPMPTPRPIARPGEPNFDFMYSGCLGPICGIFSSCQGDTSLPKIKTMAESRLAAFQEAFYEVIDGLSKAPFIGTALSPLAARLRAGRGSSDTSKAA